MAGRSVGKREDATSQAAPFRDNNSDVEQTLVSVDFRHLVGILRRRAWLVLLVAAVTVGGVWYYLNQQLPRYQARAVIRLVDRRRALTGGLVDPKSTEQTTERTMSPLLSQIQVLLSRQVASIVVDSTDAFGLRLQGEDIPAGTITNVHVDSAARLDSVQLRFLSGMVFAQGYASKRADSVAAVPSVAPGGSPAAPALQIPSPNAPASPPPSALGTQPPSSTAPTAEPSAEALALTGRAPIGQPIRMTGLSLTVSKIPTQPTIVLRLASRQDATEALLKNLDAKPRSETDVIDVFYLSTDNFAAQHIVNNAVRIFSTLNKETANQQARVKLNFVESQLKQNDSLVAEVEHAASAAFEARSKSTPGRDLSTGELVALTQMQQRQSELRTDAIFYRNSLSKLAASNTSRERMNVLRVIVSSPGFSGNTVVTQLYAQLDGMINTRDSLVSGPLATATTNPDVRRLDARIASAEAGLIDALQNYLLANEQRLAAIDTITRTMKPRVITEPEAREAGLNAQVASLRKAGDELRDQLRQARIAAAAEVGEVEIIDEAPIPTEAIGRSRVLKLALGLGAGIALGCIIAFIVEALDGLNTSIRRNSEIERLLDLPALGLIPPHEPAEGASKWRQRFQRGNGQRTAEQELVSVSKMQSPNAEAYRALRTNLLFSQAVRDLRTLVVTSATSAEGKTTTAANLAVTFARQGVRVLLVDCDLRRPRVHSIMSVPREPGLTQVLLEQLGIDEAVRPGVIPNLFVLSAGRLPPNPTELLGGTRMNALLEKLVQSYDLVVLDSPPVLLTPDAAVLGAICDGVLLVLRAGKTQQQAAREVLRQLAAVNAYLVGAVLNDPDSKVPNSDRQFAYGYGADYYAASSTGVGA